MPRNTLSQLTVAPVACWGDEEESPPPSPQAVSTPTVVVPTVPSPSLCFTHSPYGTPSTPTVDFPVEYEREEVRPVHLSPVTTPPPVHDAPRTPPKVGKQGKAGSLPSTPSSMPPFPQPVCCEVAFKGNRMGQFAAVSYITPGEYVIVEGDRGEDLGLVRNSWVAPSTMQPGTPLGGSEGSFSSGDEDPDAPSLSFDRRLATLPKVLRRANHVEIEQLHCEQRRDEHQALEDCRAKVLDRGLDMQLIDAEFQFDRQKLTFVYNAPNRVDFRDLCKELYRVYRTRIWMSRLGEATSPPRNGSFSNNPQPQGFSRSGSFGGGGTPKRTSRSSRHSTNSGRPTRGSAPSTPTTPNKSQRGSFRSKRPAGTMRSVAANS